MPRIEIYTSPLCGYCHMAKRLLKNKGLDFEEINVLGNFARRKEMERRSSGRTVPQIFIDGKSTGGCDEVYTLDKTSELDRVLRPSPV